MNDLITTQLSTDRLLLKAITPEVIHQLFNTQTKSDIMTFFGVDEEGYNHYLAMHQNGMTSHRLSLLFFLLVEKSTQTPIGECGFHTWNTTHHRAELFYKLWQDQHKQKGYMTEALLPILNYGFTQMNLHRIQAMVADYNTASLKLLAQHNFVKEGIMRQDYLVNNTYEDSHCYSLLKNEFNA